MGSPPCAIFRYPDDLRNIVQQCARGLGVRAAGLEVGAQRAPRLLVLRYFLRFQDYQEDTNFHDNNQFCDNDITDR